MTIDPQPHHDHKEKMDRNDLTMNPQPDHDHPVHPHKIDIDASSIRLMYNRSRSRPHYLQTFGRATFIIQDQGLF